MTRIALPDRALSPEEARGFRMATALISYWGYRLVAQPRLAGPKATAEVQERFRAHGRFAMAMAAGLDRMMDRDIPPEAIAEIVGQANPPAPRPRN